MNIDDVESLVCERCGREIRSNDYHDWECCAECPVCNRFVCVTCSPYYEDFRCVDCHLIEG